MLKLCNQCGVHCNVDVNLHTAEGPSEVKLQNFTRGADIDTQDTQETIILYTLFVWAHRGINIALCYHLLWLQVPASILKGVCQKTFDILQSYDAPEQQNFRSSNLNM